MGLIVTAAEGTREEGCNDRVVDEIGSTGGSEEEFTSVDSNSSSSAASKPVATDWSSTPEVS